MLKSILSLAFVFLFALLAQCQSKTAGLTQANVNKNLPVADYEAGLNQHPEAQLIDVRTAREFKGGHIKNAQNIDVTEAGFESKVSQFDKTKPVFVYCLSGGRSEDAATQMQQMGFTEVYNLDGGILSWNKAGKPLSSAQPATQTASGLTQADYAKLVNQGEYVLVDFMASWCGPCKKMAPSLDRLAERRKDVLTLQKIDADKNKQLLKAKGIGSIPYLELYKNGELIWKHSGFIDEEAMLKAIKL